MEAPVQALLKLHADFGGRIDYSNEQRLRFVPNEARRDRLGVRSWSRASSHDYRKALTCWSNAARSTRE
jgi:hypothetical protein